MTIIGCDPGTDQSAYVILNGPVDFLGALVPNADFVAWLSEIRAPETVLVIEEIESFGMAVGRETFQTVRWSGRYEQAWQPHPVHWLPRRVVKQHFCHTTRATDANIRAALIDRFGGRDLALGTKAHKGPLADLKGHLWSAFAVALAWQDQQHGAD